MKLDYKKLGLMSGLEIHAQLNTGKLFCECPSLIRDDSADFTVERKMRASAGESGKIDVAAALEQKKDKTFVYEGYNDTTCLVEIDEEPPHEVNREALKVALQVANILNCDIIDRIQVMRKTVVDGSNTSGFQRTMMIARNGFLEVGKKKIQIESICLEEDAAKIIKQDSGRTIYRLDRLGIPLIEIVTGPEISSPEEAKQVAEKIGLIIRSTGKSMRGIGTIRQDVNISIHKKNRVEIKGVQDLKQLPLIVENEIIRQLNLDDIKKKIKKSKLDSKFVELNSIFEKTESQFFRKGIEKGKSIFGMKLTGFKGFLGFEIQPGRRLGSELSDWAKVNAGVGGIIHSDELPGYGMSEKEVSELYKKLDCKNKDGFVMVIAEKEQCIKALEAVLERAKITYEGVLSHVRKANSDASTSYMRPMPGAARMYPETDVSIIIPNLKIEKVELIEDKIKKYEKLGLGGDLAKKIARSEKNSIFESLLKLKNIKAAFIAEILVSYIPEILRKYKGKDSTLIKEEHLIKIFEAVDKESVAKDSVMEILVSIASGEKFDLSKYELMSESEIKKILKEIVNKNKDTPFGALMGEAMKQLRGKADGKKIAQFLKELTKP